MDYGLPSFILTGKSKLHIQFGLQSAFRQAFPKQKSFLFEQFSHS